MIETNKPVTRRTSQGAPRTAKPAAPKVKTPLPSLAELTGPCIIEIVGRGEVVSDAHGLLPLGKRLAMAHAQMTRAAGSFLGIGTSAESAFEITDFDPKHPQYTARLKDDSAILAMPVSNASFCDQPTRSFDFRGAGVPHIQRPLVHWPH